VVTLNDTTPDGSRKLQLFWRLVESSPLAVFLLYLAFARPQLPQAWRAPYYLCASLALLTLGALRAAGVAHSRIYLALNCYFISGALALAVNWQPINQWYGSVEAAAMLCWVSVVGAVSTVVSPAGFVGVAAGTGKHTRSASLILLGVAILATTLSFATIGQPLWHAYVPFIALFSAQSLLRARLRKQALEAANVRAASLSLR
jgi:hypothetical protein